MAKARKTLRIPLPAYQTDLRRWRQRILETARAAQASRGVTYADTDRLAVSLRLYLPLRQLAKVDVDNRLKDVLDALQGQVSGGGKKLGRSRDHVIPNDAQVRRAAVEKLLRPSQAVNAPGGWVTITRLRHSRP